MGLIISKADFIGKYSIAKNNYDELEAYISKYESQYLKQLLGVELFFLFEADVVSFVPVSPIYLTIFNPISEDDTECNTIRVSDGIKEMLLGFIYFEYIRDQKFYNTPSGTVVGQQENSVQASFSDNQIYNRYNEAVMSYEVIQWYISEINNEVDYPTYNGVKKNKSFII